MKTGVRHLFSLILPILTVVLIPYWLLNANPSSDTRWEAGTAIFWIARSGGVGLTAGGLAIFVWCISLFARIGKGTLAPWDPTSNLVANGPYRHVRNPMIASVAMMIAGLTLFWGSVALSIYLIIFVAINHIYFIFSEEPGLEKRFGETYRVYKANVPRWIPRVKP